MNPADPEHEKALALALKRLKRSDAFEAEIRSVWEKSGIREEAQFAVLNYLRGKGMLNDRRSAETLARHVRGKSKGVEQLRQELQRRGATEETMEECLSLETAEQQRTAAVSLLEKRAGSIGTRAKAGRLLHSRGFSEELIESVLDEKFPLRDD